MTESLERPPASGPTLSSPPLAADLARALLSAAPDAIMLVDADGRIRLANDAALGLFGCDEADLVGTPVDSLVPDEQRAEHAGLRHRYAEHPGRRPMGTGLQLSARRRDGSLVPVEISLSPIEYEGTSMTIAAVRDVTDARDTTARITLLKERERIARDLHDMVIQRIYAAGMSIQSVIGQVDSDATRDRLNDVTDTLDETIRQLRQSIFELGRTDDRRTLSSQIAALVDDRAEHLGFAPDLRIVGPMDDLPEYVADQLVALVSEAMSNVARHASATSARAVIESGGDYVSVVVEDDGVGIRSSPKAGGGLSNMIWRATELGGSCSIESIEPSGTRLVWRVPTGAQRPTT
ncbi:PAS domain-containing sensor histidine kinase [Ilumatobacter sp.]|uniref:PAS domain-containing sensor histidine kinase n=1 Tax=Ilumatobacter sp. TaxID=1967498 RepID=UPI003C604808